MTDENTANLGGLVAREQARPDECGCEFITHEVVAQECDAVSNGSPCCL